MTDGSYYPLTREEARQAMKDGHKVSHMYYTSDEYLEMKGNAIVCENGYNMTDVFNSNRKDREWQLTNWRIRS